MVNMAGQPFPENLITVIIGRHIRRQMYTSCQWTFEQAPNGDVTCWDRWSLPNSGFCEARVRLVDTLSISDASLYRVMRAVCSQRGFSAHEEFSM